MRHLILFALLILLSSTISAQDGLTEQSYRLRQPSAEEYVSAIPEILNQWKIDMQDNKFPPRDILIALSIETHNRYREELKFTDADTLYHSFELLNTDTYFEAERETWIHAILRSWLKQNQPDLATMDTFSIGNLEIHVSPRDFNNDSQDEYLLNIQSDLYTQLVVLKTTDSGYEIVESPVSWYGCCFAYWSNLSGFMQEQYFGDLNNDGLPEWVLAEGGIGGGHMHHGKLFVVQWQNDKLVDVSADYQSGIAMYYNSPSGGGAPLFPRDVSVEFTNADDEPRIEIIIRQTFHDNWDCFSHDTRIYDWNVAITRYDLQEQSLEFEDTAECNLRHAQDAIWEQDYARAIPLLEQANQLFDLEENDDNKYMNKSDAVAYTSVRLTLAYAMVGQLDRAQETLNDIITLPKDDTIIDLVESARVSLNTEGTAIDLCFSMYSTFAELYHLWDANPYWGATSDIVTPWAAMNASAPFPDIGKAGCQIQPYINELLGKNIPINLSPLKYLQNTQIPVANYINGDLNNDGIDEWLMWLDVAYSSPILFESSGEYYRVTFQEEQHLDYIPASAPFTQWFSWELPNDDTMLGKLFFDNENTFGDIWFYLYGDMGGLIGYCLDPQGEFNTELFAGDIELYHLADNNIVRIFDGKLCEPVTLSHIFPDGEASVELVAWKRLEEQNTANAHYPLIPTTYIWDEHAGTYIDPEEDIAQATEIPQESDVESVYLDIYNLSRATKNNDFETVIDLVNEYLHDSNNAGELQSDEISVAYYHRAFAYEQLGQDDEALADFVMLYTQAPNSAWGMLAGLHIEPITSN